MAHTFTFGKVAKRKNSTLQGAVSASYDVLFKSPTSIDEPTITLHHSGDFDYNYAKYNDTYYFVTNKVSRNNDLWDISLKIDPLATYKSDILNTTAYVMYDSTPNTELVDNRLPLKTTKSVLTSSAACPFVPDGGCYILSLTGSNDTTGVYKVSESQLSALIDDASHVYDNLFDYETQHPAPTPPTGSTDVGAWFEYWCDYFSWLWGSVKYPITQIFGSGSIPENIREKINFVIAKNMETVLSCALEE